ncbi:hypothetical protein JTE90_004508 [Oedothorax gibbosus]|uniref:Uncharacterized protein n=1 Tax=Oedothorax gibbosus TaxID=931172 RepID=A0AAV6TUL5_9ARAC|nr:hypothetical protein JTE90_004508 [Oedothorax gibbosus]
MRQGTGAGLPEIGKEVWLVELETRLGIPGYQLGEPGGKGADCPGLYLRGAGIGNRDARNQACVRSGTDVALGQSAIGEGCG